LIVVVMGAVLGKLLGKKKTSKGTSRGRRWMRRWLRSPMLKRLAQTDLPLNAAPVNIEDNEEAEEETKMSFFPPNELIGLGSPVLDIVMGLLDQNSLKNCREVCSSWEDAARRALVKQCGLKLESFLLNDMRGSEKYRAELYSSWILNYTPNESSLKSIAWKKFLPKWGKVPKSLTLTGLTLNADCLVWIRKILCEWCPNVSDLNLQFQEDGREMNKTTKCKIRKEIKQFRRYLDDGDEVKFEKIWRAKERTRPSPKFCPSEWARGQIQ
jgi:hypothetical protein